tara:strand:- start:4000 stop:4797 length:798 start_codon:yes stop_codon:yes gene_type:complete
VIDFNFKNKTVLILAGSSGIGAELCNQYLEFGAKVCIISSSKNKLSQMIKKNKKYKERIMSIKFNLQRKTTIKKINKILFKVKNKFKADVDILINNSGGPPLKKIVDLKETDIFKSLNMNLINQIYFSINAIKIMNNKKWGRIINLTSSTAKEPAKNMVLSNICRAALSSFSKTLSMETAGKGVTVNTILTGGVATNRLLKLIKKRKSAKDIKRELKILSDKRPVGYLANPQNFIQLILFLSTEQASYVSGTSIFVDGGISKSLF